MLKRYILIMMLIVMIPLTYASIKICKSLKREDKFNSVVSGDFVQLCLLIKDIVEL